MRYAAAVSRCWLVSLLLFAWALALTGCKGCSGDERVVPDGVVLEVKIDGGDGPTIDTAALRQTKADFEKEGHRAWRLTTLLADRFEPEGMSVEVEDADGKRHVMRRAGAAQSKVVVVAVNRSGAMTVTLVSADAPFPPHHGRGGNRGRSGTVGRVKNAKRLWLRTGKPKPAADEGPALALELVVDGEQPRTLGRADLAKVAPQSFRPGDGEGKRSAWSLRDLATTLIGPDAAVVAVAGEGARAVELSAADWGDEGRIPLLRLNRRGQLKFVWVSQKMEALDGDEVRRVRRLEARSAAKP